MIGVKKLKNTIIFLSNTIYFVYSVCIYVEYMCYILFMNRNIDILLIASNMSYISVLFIKFMEGLDAQAYEK